MYIPNHKGGLESKSGKICDSGYPGRGHGEVGKQEGCTEGGAHRFLFLKLGAGYPNIYFLLSFRGIIHVLNILLHVQTISPKIILQRKANM